MLTGFASPRERNGLRDGNPSATEGVEGCNKEVPVMAPTRVRVLLSLVVAASGVGIGSITAAASSTGSPAANGGATAVGGSSISPVVVNRAAPPSSAIACPAEAETGFAASAPAPAGAACGTVFPCCGPSGQSGVTATGTATVAGSGKAARDQAIRDAITDARDQASVAASAAGAHVGAVVGIQISSYPIAIPLVGGAIGSGGVVQPSCPPGAKCPLPPARPAVSASVTVTWSLG